MSASATAFVLALAGCATHPGPDRLEPLNPAWTTREDGTSVGRSPTVKLAAFHHAMGSRCVFGGSVTNLSAEPVQVSFRPVGVDAGDDEVVGLHQKGRSEFHGAPIRRDEPRVLAPRDAGPNVLRFSLRPTGGPPGDADVIEPYSAGDVVTTVTTPGGVTMTTPARPPRTGDVAHYAIVVTGPDGEESWDYHFRTVPGPEIVDVHWYQWLALPLLPLYVVLKWFGAVD